MKLNTLIRSVGLQSSTVACSLGHSWWLLLEEYIVRGVALFPEMLGIMDRLVQEILVWNRTDCMFSLLLL